MNPTGQPTQGTPVPVQVSPGIQSPYFPDLSGLFNNPALAQAQNQYQQASQQALSSEQQDYTLPQMLRDALNKKFSTDNPLVQNRESALQNYLQSIPQSQASVLPQNNNGVILDPIQQANLIQARQGAALAPLATSNYLLGLSTGGIGDVISAAAAAHQGQTKGLQGRAELARQSYTDILSQLSQRAQLAMEQAKQLESMREFGVTSGLKQAELGLQYGVDPNTLQPYPGLPGGPGTPGQAASSNGLPTMDLTTQRKAYQAAYTQTTSALQQNRIEKEWEMLHPGTKLFPVAPTGDQLNQIKGNNQALEKLYQVQSILNSGKGAVGGIAGVMANTRLQHPALNALIPFGIGKPDTDTQKLFDSFLALRTLAERQQVGGRLSGYLLDVLGPAFAQLPKDRNILKREVGDAINAAKLDLQTIAQGSGYVDFKEMPGYQKPSLDAIFGK